METQMDFQQILLKVQYSLTETEVQELVFLCTDLISKDISNVITASDLFGLLETEDLLSPDDPSLLIELLKITRRHSLIQKLPADMLKLPAKDQVTSYRKLLFKLAEDISMDELKNIKFLLLNTLSRRKLEKDMTVLQLFLEMEKEDILDANNLDTLEKVIGNINPRLKKIITQFKNEGGAGIVHQEVIRNDFESSSIVRRAVQPESTFQKEDTYAVHRQDLESPEKLMPPSFFSQPHRSEAEAPLPLSSFIGDGVAAQVDSLASSLSKCSSQDLNQVKTHHGSFISDPEVKDLKSSGSIQNNPPELEQYDMGDWRGYCLIINNKKFSESSTLKNREGTDVDEKRLQDVFQWLGFTPLVEKDCTAKCIIQALDNLAKRDHTQADCVACCVLSHGYEGGVYGVDGSQVSLRELREPLSGNCCLSLSQKPKLFFIQACQGTEEQHPVFQTDSPSDVSCDASVPRDSTPHLAHFLTAMATVAHFVSFRDKLNGTWFIQSLCENLIQLVPKGVDLLSILTQVNNDVSKKTDKSGTKKQIPQPEFSLTKRVVFPNPKSDPPLHRVHTLTL